MMFSQNFWLTVFGVYISGCFASIQVGIGYIYMMEIFSKKNRFFYSGFYMALDSGVNIVTALYYGNISNNWVYLTGTGYII